MNSLIQLTAEEIDYIDIENERLKRFESNPEQYTDEEIKIAFDSFFETINAWRDKYDTKNLSEFYAIGYNYDGYTPGINKPFMELYRELMSYVEDKVIDKPVVYIQEMDGEVVEVEHYDDGTKKVIGPVK